MKDKWFYLQSPQDIGSYFAGLVTDVHDGTTPSTQLKLSPITVNRAIQFQAGRINLPKKKGIDTRSAVDRL